MQLDPIILGRVFHCNQNNAYDHLKNSRDQEKYCFQKRRHVVKSTEVVLCPEY